ncbi:Pre-mRNA-splicing factor Cwf15/Cwc15 [Mycena belliarum]|uniref:Pre-mRNA-splicing factor Cwf15/Cwc15 n=1 Tax=Mycena belliarum TaxID=1033014 RepID=A0AAD6U087_9AGAR|nr:Pre-mRNA-splicing factor Cwf15/Cwc15 [Mycena belliae]
MPAGHPGSRVTWARKRCVGRSLKLVLHQFCTTMSTAHRPTWDPAQAKDVKGGSRQFSVRDMAMHTKLKFRQVGQTSVAEVKKRDLRSELFAAELEAKNKKRKAEGLPPLAVESGTPADEEANKRRKLLQDSIDLDKDDEEEGDADADADGKAAEEKDKDADNSDSDSDEDDDDDDTAELLRELEKIKRERAEEKARVEREQSASDAASRDAEIATGNPLLNLAAALGQQVPSGVNTTVPGSFAVKKRWDDDLIFKNQAVSTREKPTHFVNDLLRTEFHKKFMAKFIK